MQTTCCGWTGLSWSKGTLKAMTAICGHVKVAPACQRVPLSLGGLGLRSATRTRKAACQLGRLSVHGEEQASSRG